MRSALLDYDYDDKPVHSSIYKARHAFAAIDACFVLSFEKSKLRTFRTQELKISKRITNIKDQ